MIWAFFYRAIAASIAVKTSCNLEMLPGDLFGFGDPNNTAYALAGENIHQITLNTGTAGTKNGMLTVSSTRQAVANGFFSFPISFEVLGNADHDGDGDVDGADFLVWQQGSADSQDLAMWQQQFGNTAITAITIPEPTTIEDLVIILVLVFLAHITRQDVTRKWRRFREQRLE